MPAIKPTIVIYGLLDPRDGLFHYVGQAKDLKQRMFGHFTPKHQNADVRAWIVDMQGAGVNLEIRILDGAIGKYDGSEKELYWIRRLYVEGHPLVNRKGFFRGMFENTNGRKWRVPREKVKGMLERLQYCDRAKLIEPNFYDPNYYESIKAAIDFWHEKRDEMFSEYDLLIDGHPLTNKEAPNGR